MNIVKATHRFEKWLGQHIALITPDLRFKHQRMAESPFPFFRATFYRWIQLWPDVCPELNKAPKILGVGDLHVENFGTWRDIEGRLVWGVNDFDEAATYPYVLDLVRLAVSADLASEEGHLKLKLKDACSALIDGYCESLKNGGRPFVLEEENAWLRAIATNELRDPVHFWKKLSSLPIFREVQESAREALEHVMPQRGLEYHTVRRVAGLGSLGHVRVVALADYRGGKIAREAKTLAPSSIHWALEREGPHEIMYQTVVGRAIRCPDPFLLLQGHWVVRRLSPHCCRIELAVLPTDRDELKLLHAMGWETANVHLGTAEAAKYILRDLNQKKPNWLLNAAHDMSKAVTSDWRDWNKEYKPA